MSGQDALEELQLNIQEALEQELLTNERPRLDQAFTSKFSVRDLGQQDSNTDRHVSRTDLLEAWQSLVQRLFTLQVFLQYTPALERLFIRLSLDDPSEWEDIKTLLELMTETVNNHEKDPSTECRYVTLLEVLTTYGPNWEVSQQVQRTWEKQNQYLDPSLSPEEFRQTAYGVLMLLSYVPNSIGLRQACSIPDEESIDEEEVPLALESVFDQIRSTQLPRHDAIHRILSHLDTEDIPTVAISSLVDESLHESSSRCHGIGKTTLAALVASAPQVQADYDVLWLRLKHRSGESETMTYQHYVEYLSALCEQLELESDWSKPMRVLEELALRKKREEEKMFQLKNEMAQLLRDNTSGLLLILDDVRDDQEIEWFRFLERQSLVVTTQSHNLSVTWTLDVELLTEEEALKLFLTEAEYPPEDTLGSSLEAKSIVQRCGYHPLTIRMVARWFALKEATAGVVKAAEELGQELSTCTAKLRHSHSYKANPEYILTEVMNLMLSPVLAAGGHPTSLMKMCLSSLAVVFEQPVPRDAVILLWEELLRTEPQALAELGDNLSSGNISKRVRFNMEALTSLGFLTISEKDGRSYLEIPHETQLEYAKNLARELNFGVDEMETAQRWHKAFVTSYLAKKAENEREGEDDLCLEYAIEKLVLHMIRARRFKKASTFLRDDRFLVEQFTTKDFEAGTALHLQDCKELLNAMESDGDSKKDPFEIVASIQTKVAAFIVSEAQGKDEDIIQQAGKAVQELSFALAENGFSPEAITQYRSALKIVPKRSPISCMLLYGLGAINLIQNEHAKGLKNLNECLKGMMHIDNGRFFFSEALLLKGDALMAQCDYEEAMRYYDESLDTLLADSTNNRVEIGLAIYRKGMLHFARGQLDEALRVLGDSIALKLQIGESSANLATAYYFVGHLYMEQKWNLKAIENFEKALRIMKENLDETEPKDVFLTTGMLCHLRDDIDGCLDAFDLALKQIRDAPRMEMDRAIHDLRSIACVYASNGDYVGALPIFDEALDLTEDRPFSLERASLLYYMAMCESEECEYEEAVYHLKESLKIRREKLEMGEVVIQTLITLGETYKAMGEMEEAISYYNDALESTEMTHGEDNENVASLLYSLGDIKESTGENVEALANFEECLEIRRRHLEVTSVVVADTLERIGSIYMRQGNSEKAYPYYAEALDIRQATFEPDDPALAESFYNIGMAARKRGDCEHALHFLLGSLQIREKHEQQRQMCETLLEIGHLHRQLTDYESARGCYVKCLEIVHENYGQSDKMASDVLFPLGQVYRNDGDVDRALECFEEGKVWVYECRELVDSRFQASHLFRSSWQPCLFGQTCIHVITLK